MTSTAHSSTEPIVREMHIKAPPAAVFPYFTDADKMTRWLCTEAIADARPGGRNYQVHIDDNGARHQMEGQFVEVSPPSRVTFKWSFAGSDMSSLVEVTLTPADGGTQLRLVHSNLLADAIKDHTEGWTKLLAKLATVI